MKMKKTFEQSELPARSRWTYRRGSTPLRSWLFLALALMLFVPLGFATPLLAETESLATDSSTSASSRTLFLAEVQLSGASRTSIETVMDFFPLHPGQSIDQDLLVESVTKLRESGLFRKVTFFTRPGPERGYLVLVLEVEEHTLDFRWAAGNTNIDGWYLVPAMLAYDNPLGKGGIFDLQYRVGFRHSGFLLRYGHPGINDGDSYWGTRLSAISTDRPYFLEGEEYWHNIKTVGLTALFIEGRRSSF